jgi:PAS domain S-box-containing protein
VRLFPLLPAGDALPMGKAPVFDINPAADYTFHMRIISVFTTIIAATIVILPLCIIFIIDPAFTRLAEENANQESVLVATHLAASLLAEDGDIAARRLPLNFAAEAARVKQDFRLLRLRVLTPAGEIIFSTDAGETGSFNRQDFFREKVARGKTHSQVVRRGNKTLEGELARIDVAETYVPLIRDGRVIGAFEIYYDISRRIANLDRVMARSNQLLFGAVTVLLAIATILFLRARKSQAERDRAREEWEKTFEAVTDPIMIVTREFTIARANKAMADWIGVSREEAVGRHCFHQVHLCNEPVAGCPHKKLLEDGTAHSAEIYDAHSGRYFSVAVYPLFDAAGALSGSVHYAKDITINKQAIDALEATAFSLAEAQRIAQLGSWELDLTANTMKGSAETCRIFEIEQSSRQAPQAAMLERIHPEDRGLVDEAYARALTTRAPVEIVHRLRLPDDRIKYVQDRCEAICDDTGRLERLVGTVQDITEQKLAEEAVRESEEKFKMLAASAQDAIILMDGDGNVAFWNDAAAAVFGYDREEAIGREVHRLIVPERFYRDFCQGFSRFQGSGEGVFVGKTLELLAKKKDGTEFPVEFSVSALRVRHKWQAISILRDITDRKSSETLIQQQLKNMTALSDIGMAISSSLDIRVTLKILLERLISQLGIDAASVLLLEQESLFLKCAASLGFRTQSIRKTSVRMGKGHAGQAALERRIMIIPDLSDTLTHSLKEENFRSYVAVPLLAQGKVVGVLELFHRSSIDPSPEWLGFLELMAAQAAIAIDNATMFHNLQRTNTELTLSYDATLEGWGRALELRDEDTMGHTERVTGMAVQFAHLMGLDEREIVHLRRGALLHDIGKISIPDAILLKPGPLTPAEREIMQRHTSYARMLLQPIPFLRPALDIPYCHHEKWDGSGTPRGLKGEEIPLAARIFAVVDVWDALMSDRPYRKAWPFPEVKEFIRLRSGTDFDPQVVDIFLRYLDDNSGEELWGTRKRQEKTPS